MKGSEKEVVLVLTEAEHDYLMGLLLDFGAYHAPQAQRTPLVKKLAHAHPVRDVGWFERRVSRRAEGVRVPGRALPAGAG